MPMDIRNFFGKATTSSSSSTTASSSRQQQSTTFKNSSQKNLQHNSKAETQTRTTPTTASSSVMNQVGTTSRTAVKNNDKKKYSTKGTDKETNDDDDGDDDDVVVMDVAHGKSHQQERGNSSSSSSSRPMSKRKSRVIIDHSDDGNDDDDVAVVNDTIYSNHQHQQGSGTIPLTSIPPVKKPWKGKSSQAERNTMDDSATKDDDPSHKEQLKQNNEQRRRRREDITTGGKRSKSSGNDDDDDDWVIQPEQRKGDHEYHHVDNTVPNNNNSSRGQRNIMKKRTLDHNDEEDNDDDDNNDIDTMTMDKFTETSSLPPRRKSPRKHSLVSSKWMDASSPTPSRKSPRKAVSKPIDTSSSSSSPEAMVVDDITTTVSSSNTMEPLEPGLELTWFDPNTAVVSEFLAGTTFVFSGVIPNLTREAAQELIKVCGGRVTTSVSSKTTYLVLGDILEDGRPVTEGKKYQMAVQQEPNKKKKNHHKVHLVRGEKELYGLISLYHDRAVQEHHQQQRQQHPNTTTTTTTGSARTMWPNISASLTKSRSNVAPGQGVATHDGRTTLKAETVMSLNSDNNLSKSGSSCNVAPIQAAISTSRINPYAKKVANPYAATKTITTTTTTAMLHATSVVSAVAIGKSDHKDLRRSSSNQLWADKYAPQSSLDVLGNKDMVDKLSNWLDRWETIFLGNSKAKRWSSSSDSGPKRAALLSGPPGIGKTTTALLVSKEANRDIIEFNASDVRSKKALHTEIGDVTGSQSIHFATITTNKSNKGNTGAAAAAGGAARKRVLIMDEVDGMGAGDRGGMSELIQMIKTSRVPIICICNDRQSQKIRSLVPYCLDLRFRRPTKNIIANRAIRVAAMEGMTVERNAAEAIAESCGNDVRQVLNCLQMWGANHNHNESMTYKNLKQRENLINKDDILRVNMFDATRQIVEGRRGLAGADKKIEMDSFFKRNDAFFVDYGFMGLNVHQNYLKVMVGPFNEVKRTDDSEKIAAGLERLHDAAHTMSDFAVVEREIRGGDMNWGLLPFAAVLTVKTGFHAGGEQGAMYPGFPEFTGWMGKNSTRGKKFRILQELGHHMNYKVSGGRDELRLSYLPVVRERLYSMIANSDDSDTTRAIQLMDEYGLDRDDVFEKLDEFKTDSKVDFGKIEGKAKAAFTREYNSMTHKSQALVAEQGGSGSKRKRGEKTASDPADLDAIDEDNALGADEESDEDAEEEDLEKIKKMFGKSKGGRRSGGKPAAPRKGAGGGGATGRQTKKKTKK